MSVRELLKPRYEVIADYPESGFSVGDILKWDENGIGWKAEGCDDFYEFGIHKYPHLFRRLEWWEHRKDEDLPKYIRFIKDYMDYKKGSLYKVESWGEITGIRLEGKKYGLYRKQAIWCMLPASEKEYQKSANKFGNVTNPA